MECKNTGKATAEIPVPGLHTVEVRSTGEEIEPKEVHLIHSPPTKNDPIDSERDCH